MFPPFTVYLIRFTWARTRSNTGHGRLSNIDYLEIYLILLSEMDLRFHPLRRGPMHMKVEVEVVVDMEWDQEQSLLAVLIPD